MYKLISNSQYSNKEEEKNILKKITILTTLSFRTQQESSNKSTTQQSIKNGISKLLEKRDVVFSTLAKRSSNSHVFATLLFLASEHETLTDFLSYLNHDQKREIATITDNNGDTLLHLMFSFGEKDILTTQPYFKELYYLYCNSLPSTQLVTKTSNSSTLHFPETPLFLTALEHRNESMMVYALRHFTDGMNKRYVDYKTFHQNVWDKSKSPFEIKQTLLSNCLNDLDHPLHTIPKTTRLLGLLFELAIEFKVEDYLQSCLTRLPISDTYSTPKLASESNPLFDENAYLFSPLLVAARAGRLDIMQALIDLGHPMGYERIKPFSLENTVTLNNHCYYEPQSSSTYLVKHLLTIAFDSVDSDRLNDFSTFLSHQQNKLTQEDTTYITRSIFLSLACKSHNATQYLNGEASALAVETLENHERFLSKVEPQILAQTILDIRKYMIEKDISLLLISFSSALNKLIQQDISIDLAPTYCDQFSTSLIDTALYTHGFNDSLLYTTPDDENYIQTENNRLYFIFFLDHVWPLCSENTKQMILTPLDQTTETLQEHAFKQSIKRCLSDDFINNETPPLELSSNQLTKKLESTPVPLVFENKLRQCNNILTLGLFISYLEPTSQQPTALLKKIIPTALKSEKLNDKETSRLKELGFMKQFFQHLYDIKAFKNIVKNTLTSSQTLVYPALHHTFKEQLLSTVKADSYLSLQGLKTLNELLKGYLEKADYEQFQKIYKNCTNHSFMRTIFLKEFHTLSKQLKLLVHTPENPNFINQVAIGVSVIHSNFTSSYKKFPPIQRGHIVSEDLDLSLHSYKGALIITPHHKMPLEKHSGPVLIIYNESHYLITSASKGVLSNTCTIAIPHYIDTPLKGKLITPTRDTVIDYKLSQPDLSESGFENFYTSFLETPQESDDNPYEYPEQQKRDPLFNDIVISVKLNAGDTRLIQLEGMSRQILQEIKS